MIWERYGTGAYQHEFLDAQPLKRVDLVSFVQGVKWLRYITEWADITSDSWLGIIIGMAFLEAICIRGCSGSDLLLYEVTVYRIPQMQKRRLKLKYDHYSTAI